MEKILEILLAALADEGGRVKAIVDRYARAASWMKTEQ